MQHLIVNVKKDENSRRKQISSPRVREIVKYVKKDSFLYLLLLVPVIYFIIFKYGTMFGNILAFRSYRPGLSLLGTKWVGFKYFEMFITDRAFLNAFKNTFILSSLNLIIGFPLPIIFALLLNEVKAVSGKKLIQSISYLPRFISTVVVVGMLQEMLSPSTGLINTLIGYLGFSPVHFLIEPSWFKAIYITSDLWQWMGWNSIIYFAALSNIDIGLYEAAIMDGAGRFKQIIHITLPCIMPTILIILILAMGNILGVGFEKVLLLYNSSNSPASDVIGTYVYRMGIAGANFSYATAVGLFEGVVGLIFLMTANSIARKFSENSLF
jgi:putative aldouronate transport system permease protein